MLDVTARSRAAVLALLGGTAALAVCACATIPPGRSAVDVVEILGARDVPADDTADRLATTASPKFLGLFRGIVFDYSIFDAPTLQRDLARVERYYRGKGFFEAHARTARVIPDGAGHVRVEIVVEEGTPTLDRRTQIDGLETLSPAVADEARAAVDSALPVGARFDEDAYKGAQATLTRVLTDEGYAYARVEVSAEADLPAHVVDYTFKVVPGPSTRLGPVTIVSVGADGSTGPLGDIDEAPVRRALHLREGAPFSTTKIESATQALLDLKVFSAVDIVPGLSDPPSDVVPLTVKVTPTKLRTLRLGGGVELDEIKTELHALAGWEDLNFLGGLRDLNVNFSPGVVLYPVRVNDLVPQPPAPFRLLPEEHLRAELRQASFIEARTSLFIRPEINVYPLLVPESGADTHTDVEVVGYVEPRVAIGVDRRFGRRFSARLAQNVQAEIPFSY
ncbi:MAG: POTRA domain-containing protein, partial [Polyangiaceae bacterium]